MRPCPSLDGSTHVSRAAEKRVGAPAFPEPAKFSIKVAPEIIWRSAEHSARRKPGTAPGRDALSDLVSRARLALGLVGCAVMIGVGGCATFACQPVNVVVANKQEIRRLETTPRAVATTPSGRLDQVPTIVREHWVQSEDGAWYRVSPDQYQTAQIGRAMQTCR
jgi:hypothetical protein